MIPTLTLSGDFHHPDDDQLCEELEEVGLWTPGQSASIDLRELGVVGPRSLAILLASLRGLHRRQICNPLRDLETPKGGPHSCLEREALSDLISEGIGHWQVIGGDSNRILGCEPFSTGAEIDRMIANVVQKLAIYASWSVASLTSLGTMLLELSENVLQHADAHGGVVVVEIRPSEETVNIAIADNGVGVRTSLSKNAAYADIGDDLTAIATAMAPGRSSEAGTGGGMGLYLSRLVVRQAQGTFVVRSGDACREESERRHESSQLAHLNGTLVAVEANTATAFDYGRIDVSLREPSGVQG